MNDATKSDVLAIEMLKQQTVFLLGIEKQLSATGVVTLSLAHLLTISKVTETLNAFRLYLSTIDKSE